MRTSMEAAGEAESMRLRAIGEAQTKAGWKGG